MGSPHFTVVKQVISGWVVNVNQVLGSDQYPLPSAQDLFAQLSEASISQGLI